MINEEPHTTMGIIMKSLRLFYILLFLVISSVVFAQVNKGEKILAIQASLTEKNSLLRIYIKDILSYHKQKDDQTLIMLVLNGFLLSVTHLDVATINYCNLHFCVTEKKYIRMSSDLICENVKNGNEKIETVISYINEAFGNVQHGGLIQSMNDSKKTLREIIDLNNQLIAELKK